MLSRLSFLMPPWSALWRGWVGWATFTYGRCAARGGARFYFAGVALGFVGAVRTGLTFRCIGFSRKDIHVEPTGRARVSSRARWLPLVRVVRDTTSWPLAIAESGDLVGYLFCCIGILDPPFRFCLSQSRPVSSHCHDDIARSSMVLRTSVTASVRSWNVSALSDSCHSSERSSK